MKVESGSVAKIITMKNVWVISSLHVSSLHRGCKSHAPTRAPLPSTLFPYSRLPKEPSKYLMLYLQDLMV